MERSEGAFVVAGAMEPGVVDLEGEEDAAGTEYAKSFGEHAVLEFAGLQMMQDEDANGGAEGLVGEGESGGVALDRGDGIAGVARVQALGGVGVVFERGDAGDAGAEMGSGRSVAGANFEKVIAKAGVGQEPRE